MGFRTRAFLGPLCCQPQKELEALGVGRKSLNSKRIRKSVTKEAALRLEEQVGCYRLRQGKKVTI